MPSLILHPFTPRALKASERENVIRPFLRWVGGKQKLLGSLRERLPLHHETRAYHEPFLGAASLFFAQEFKPAHLSDLNPHLINTYKVVKASPDELYNLLRKHKTALEGRGKGYYYLQRDLFNKVGFNKLSPLANLAQAARFIFLNHTNYNGMFRVNRKGEYNVPFGKLKPHIPTLEQLRECSARLQDATLVHQSFEQIIDKVQPGDFVYLDPPYPAYSKTAKFTNYTTQQFSEREQRELNAFATALKDRGADIMISISDVSLVRDLYQSPDWQYHNTQVTRTVSAKRPAIKVPELILTSYTV